MRTACASPPAGDRVLYSQTYYSIGGGFIVDEAHFGQTTDAPVAVPYPIKTPPTCSVTAAKPGCRSPA